MSNFWGAVQERRIRRAFPAKPWKVSAKRQQAGARTARQGCCCPQHLHCNRRRPYIPAMVPSPIAILSAVLCHPECAPLCHPEGSEGSFCLQMLHFVQHDTGEILHDSEGDFNDKSFEPDLLPRRIRRTDRKSCNCLIYAINFLPHIF